MRKKIHIILFCLSIIFVCDLKSQDPHFSQFYANPLYMNPAFTGSNICPRGILNFRDQWPSIPGTFVTYNASYDQYFDAVHGGFGLLAFADRAGQGTLVTNSISGLYAYNLSINEKFSIKAGFQAGYFWKKLDWSNLTFGDMIDEKYGFTKATNEPAPDNSSAHSTDFSAGVLGYSERFFFGFAAHHLTEPNESFYNSTSKLPRKYTAHIGAVFNISGRDGGKKFDEEATTISPNLVYQKQQEFQQLNYGFYLNKYPFVGGLWLRQSMGSNSNIDAFIVLIGLQTSNMKFGYSYDITVSKLTNASGGAHEISFALTFECPTQKKRLKVINCPTF